jgi:ribose transport system substrate-binding protein
MKKGLLVGLMVLAFIVSFASTGLAQKKVLIAASFANQINQAWINMGKGIKEECQKMGYDLIVVDAEDKPAKQISDTEDALAKKPDVLLLNGVDSSAAQLAEMAQKRGIPCIFLGRNYGNATCFIGADNYTTGVMFTEYHAKLAAGKEWKLIAITGTPGAASSVDREKGFDATLPKFPNLKVLARQAGYYRRDKTLPVAEDLLQRHPDVQGIMGWNDEVAMGALAAVKSQNRKGIAITGGDGNRDTCEAILKGEVNASLMYDLKGIGHLGVQTAAKILKGEQVDKIIFVPQIWLTKDNVEQFLKQMQ